MGETASLKPSIRNVSIESIKGETKLTVRSIIQRASEIKYLYSTEENGEYAEVPKENYTMEETNSSCVIENVQVGVMYYIKIEATNENGMAEKIQTGGFEVLVEQITIPATSLASFGLTAPKLTKNVLPSNATNKNTTWISSNPNVATVSETGEVIFTGLGTTKITCESQDEGKTVSNECVLTVVIPVYDYVNYVSPEVNYTTNASSCGGTSSTFGSYTGKWVVAYGDATYGTQIVTSKGVGTLTMTGFNGYQNLIKELNTICQKYMNTGYSLRSRQIYSQPDFPQDSPLLAINDPKVTSQGAYWRSRSPDNTALASTSWAQGDLHMNSVLGSEDTDRIWYAFRVARY